MTSHPPHFDSTPVCGHITRGRGCVTLTEKSLLQETTDDLQLLTNLAISALNHGSCLDVIEENTGNKIVIQVINKVTQIIEHDYQFIPTRLIILTN